MSKKFELLRKEFGNFNYDGFSIKKGEASISICFDFSIDGLCGFHPTITIMTDNLDIINSFNSERGRSIVFSLGMVEAVSYWKCVCSENFNIRCGRINQEDKLWWKKLWFNGLSEMFYRNGINTDIGSFVNINCIIDGERKTGFSPFRKSEISIVPVGGGKDSVVTLELLDEIKPAIKALTVNDQPARTQCVQVAGIGAENTIRTYRTIDRELLNLNAEGFLNGHTPFSAIVAFLSLYCAYLIGAENIILSNESSANESNVAGTEINHQYSKSFEFEKDFNNYVSTHFDMPVRYFSLLRPFNELQIAKQFSKYKKYHSVFRSCNAGSKKNIWCCNCAKCLFVYIILSPFLSRGELFEIFSCDMLEKESLLNEFCGLVGFSDVKPFECIGTVGEVRFALELTLKKYEEAGEKLPVMLEYYKNIRHLQAESINLLCAFNKDNNIPQGFLKFVEEMYHYVSVCG